MGDYVEVTEDLQMALKFGYRKRPSLLTAVAKLHAGSFIVDKAVILVLTAEAYGRAVSQDIHAETNMKSMPQDDCMYHPWLCAGIFEEADGHATKNKLKIGSKTMNILPTVSAPLLDDRCVDVGPATSVPVNSVRPKHARIFYRRANVDNFLQAFHDSTFSFSPPTISCLHQIVSGFDDKSSYVPWRATIDGLDTGYTLPTTIFILCDTPHNQGYGSSAGSAAKISSRFLQALGTSILENTTPEFSTALAVVAPTAKVREIKPQENSKG